MNKKGMSYTSLFFLVLFCVMGLAVANYSGDKNITDIIDQRMEGAYENFTTYFEYLETNSTPNILINIVYKLVDVTMYVYINVIKLATRVAVEHPEVNFMLIIKLLIWALVLMILVPLIKLLVILFILISDTIKHFKEKKELRRLRNEQTKRKV